MLKSMYNLLSALSEENLIQLKNKYSIKESAYNLEREKTLKSLTIKYSILDRPRQFEFIETVENLLGDYQIKKI